MSATGASIRAHKRPVSPSPGNRLVDGFRTFTRVVLWLALVLGAVFGAWRSWHYLQSADNFPIRSVVVEGRFQYLDRTELRARVLAYSPQGFFAIDVDALRQDLEQFAWVSSAGIQRVWPEGIVLNISEHTPVARWNADFLLTASGRVIEPPQLNEQHERRDAWREHFQRLPFLQGEAGAPLQVWQKYLQARKALHGIGVNLQGVHNDRRQAVTLVLQGGVSVRLGRGWFDERLNRFVASFERYIAPRLDKISYVDMRYPNGFSIGGLAGSGS